MDVNGTKFHLLFGESDWTPLIQQDKTSEPDLWWNESRDTLSLRPILFQFPTPPGDKLPRPEDRRGAAADRFGNWYWLDKSESEILILPVGSSKAGSSQPIHFWSAADLAETVDEDDGTGAFGPINPPLPPSLQLRGLTVTEHHYLVVGVVDPAGLLIFDLHAGGPPLQITWPVDVPFAPFDMAPAPDGGVWILDEEPRYWALDRTFRVITADQVTTTLTPARVDDFQVDGFQPGNDAPHKRPAQVFPTGISLEMSSPVEAHYPAAIEALPDGSVLILDSDPALSYSVITHYRFGQQLGPGYALDKALSVFAEDKPKSEQGPLRGHDMAFVSDDNMAAGQVTGTLYLAANDGNQAIAFHFRSDDGGLKLVLQPHYLPMRLFSGVGLVAAGQKVYYHNLQEFWLQLLELPKPRYVLEGDLKTPVFDGKEPDTVWHRLFLDAHIPPGDEVLIESRTANELTLVEQAEWLAEPQLYLRGSDQTELSYYRPFGDLENEQDGTGTWELLLQQAYGRYLQLRLTIRGSGRSTPKLRALRVYYPRFSYLSEYLPAVYGYDPTSASYLERFLANMEGLYTEIEGRITEVQTMFDVRSAAAEHLEWLARWFGVALDPSWDESRRRLFLAHALELFNQRGTPAGLIRAVRLAIDPCPDDSLFSEEMLGSGYGCSGEGCEEKFVRNSVRIVEQFLTRSRPGVVYGDPTDLTGPAIVDPEAAWTPAQGAGPLHAKYRAFLQARYLNPATGAEDIQELNKAWETTRYTAFTEIFFSPLQPANPTEAEAWRAFTQGALGFTYAAILPADKGAYQGFLARRYRQVAKLNQAYQWAGSGAYQAFQRIPLPAEDDFPTGGARLYDWIQFVSLVMPVKDSAHRFTILVPTGAKRDAESLNQRLELVQRIVELEKPIHTSFEVKPYWDLFRVGEVRLGIDTLLDVGSRFVALMLGQSYLGESHLAPEHPWNVTDRIVTGRDTPGEEMVL